MPVAAPSRVKRQKLDEPAVVGKDVLELLSSAMYVDPLSIYREYVQNAADAIDEAQEAGYYEKSNAPRIDVFLDLRERSIRIRDNGAGVPTNVFARRLTALGASKKRGTHARGFRGVGRLAGLAYCQELIFRGKAKGAPHVREIHWDCVRLKALLREHTYDGELHSIMLEIVDFDTLSPDGFPEHFFEVELRGVNRIRNDVLLNEGVVKEYLAQIAPLPFSKDFSFGKVITDKLAEYGIGGSHCVFLNGSDRSITRPFVDLFQARKQKVDKFGSVDFFEVPGLSGDLDAVGWILQHGYYGALPDSSPIRGLRLRAGNMQIGTANIFDPAFPEVRFNGWTVGEIHLLSNKLVPNGRRDDLEQSVHQQNLITHVMPYAKKISKLARQKSAQRNELKAGLASPGVADLHALVGIRQKRWLQRQSKPVAKAYERTLTLVFDSCRQGERALLLKKVLEKLCQ